MKLRGWNLASLWANKGGREEENSWMGWLNKHLFHDEISAPSFSVGEMFQLKLIACSADSNQFEKTAERTRGWVKIERKMYIFGWRLTKIN